MKIKFIDINNRLVAKVRYAARKHNLPVKAVKGDIFEYRGVIVSASNPRFSMGGGLDALIAKNFPREVKQIKKRQGNQRIGDVIFTITAGNDFKATPELVKKAIQFAISKLKKDEVLLLSGLGTGIGGLDQKLFVKLFVEALKPQIKQVKVKKTTTKKASKTTSKLEWKFLLEGMKSSTKGTVWKIGEWQKVKGEIISCHNGFHCSPTPIEALIYVKGEVLAQVEGRGDKDKEDDKTAYREMRIVRAWKWTKKDSVAMSIFVAELMIQNFEKIYPNDNRPRLAIEAAKKWLAKPTEANASAAYSAYLVAYSAYLVAYSAAYSAARSAAYSASWAAYSADSVVVKTISNWMIARTSELEEIK